MCTEAISISCRIKTFKCPENLCSREDLHLKLVDAGGDWGPVLVDRIIKELQKGLGKRIEGLEMRQQKASVVIFYDNNK